MPRKTTKADTGNYFQTVPPLTNFKVRFRPKTDDPRSREAAPPVVIEDTPTKVNDKQAELIREQLEDDFFKLSRYVRAVDADALKAAEKAAETAEVEAKADAE